MKVANSALGLFIVAILVLSSCHEFGHDRDRPGSYSGRQSRMEVLEGTVTIVDRGHGTFQMGLRDSSKIVFFIVEDTRPSAKERFGRLQVGDYVRAEGRSMGNSRFDLESFR